MVYGNFNHSQSVHSQHLPFGCGLPVDWRPITAKWVVRKCPDLHPSPPISQPRTVMAFPYKKQIIQARLLA